MGDNIYVSADKSTVVSENDPGKKWQMSRKEAVRLGLLKDENAKPQARRVAEDTTRRLSEPREDTATPRSTPKAAKK